MSGRCCRSIIWFDCLVGVPGCISNGDIEMWLGKAIRVEAVGGGIHVGVCVSKGKMHVEGDEGSLAIIKLWSRCPELRESGER